MENKVTLAEAMKAYETESHIAPTSAFLVRLDGKTFSSFTSKFRKPFDPRFTRAMVRTAAGMARFFNSSAVFCCSDEITLVHPPIYGKMLDHPYSARTNKIATLAAGKCSTLFLMAVLEEVKDDAALVAHVMKQAPCFDARVMEFPSGEAQVDVAKNLFWRSCVDCKKNTISSYARYLLGTKGALNKHSGQLLEAMQDPALVNQEKLLALNTPAATPEGGFDLNQLFPHQVYGVYLKRREVTMKSAQTGEQFTRAPYVPFEFAMNNRDFDSAAKFLLEPKLTEEMSPLVEAVGAVVSELLTPVVEDPAAHNPLASSS